LLLKRDFYPNNLLSYVLNDKDCLMIPGEGLFLREIDPNAIEPSRVGVLLLF
jgi:hypothetical protein